MPSLNNSQFGNLDKHDYAERGWSSVHPNQPGSNQGQFDLGPDHPAMRRETLFEDLPKEHQEQLHQHVQEKHGVTYEDMVHHAGASIDRGFTRAHAASEVAKVANRHQEIRSGVPSLPEHVSDEPAGQRWYAGGKGTAQAENQAVGKGSGIPAHVVGYMRASMSHNMPANKEAGRVRAVAGAMKDNPDPEQFGPTESGGTPSHGFHWNARNAARILQGHQQGVHPMDVRGENTSGNPSRAVTGGEGPKPASYAQSYSHPWQADARPASDRWLYRTVFNTNDNKKLKQIQEHSLAKSKVPDPENPGGQTHGVNLMAASAMSEASRRRGLSPSEGQTVSWNEDKNVAEGRSRPLDDESHYNVQHPGQGKLV